MVGAITTLGMRCVLLKRWTAEEQESVLCRFLHGAGSGAQREKQRAFGTATRIMRVAVLRRRGPAGLRDPIAASLTVLMGFAALLSRFVGV